MRIACLQNHPVEGPAGLVAWAAQRDHQLRVFPCDESGKPPEIAGYDALIVMGGPMSVRIVPDKGPARAALDAIRAFLDAGKPVLGICLGAQILAVAAGGHVVAGPTPEIGWWPVEVLEAAAHSPLGSMPNEATVFHWHGDSIVAPPDATILARTEVCPVQAFTVGKQALGLQFHLEVDGAAVTAMTEAFGDELKAGSSFVQTAEELRAGVSRHGGSCARYLQAMADAWLNGSTSRPGTNRADLREPA